MATQPTPYLPRNPGDLITAGDWNEVQVDVKKDISDQIKTAVGQIKRADRADSAGNADTLGGKTADQLTKEIIQKALEELPLRTGYRRTFNRLIKGKEKVIKHGLGAFPLVDVYQLDYFKVVCARGETPADQAVAWVNFYLYHTSERRIRAAGTPVDIEPPDVQPFRVPFADMLELYQVDTPDDTTLDELETGKKGFWDTFFASPNYDEFDADQYCHSPWFEKCCGEKRTVAELKRGRDWGNIWFKMAPRKTNNYPGVKTEGTSPSYFPSPLFPVGTVPPSPAPSQIQVVHFDFDTLGIKLLAAPVYPSEWVVPDAVREELKVMLLLKV